MTGQLLLNLLQVSQSTGESDNIFLADGTTKVKVYHWNTWQANGGEAVVYHNIGKTPNRCKTGVSYIDDVQVQITVWNADSFEAATVAKNIRTVLEGWEGTYDNVKYYKILFDSEVESFEPELQYYGVVQTYTISNAR